MKHQNRFISWQVWLSYLIVLFSASPSSSQSSSTPTTFLTSNETDRSSLLQFKSLLAVSNGTLASWGNETLPMCLWQGVTCGEGPTANRVVTLNLGSLDLRGTISPHIANLTFLQNLYLNYTNLRGTIPPELFLMPRLKELRLNSNNLEGEIPATLTQCSSLRRISLRNNLLTGEIPKDIGNLSIGYLNLGHNNITGSIPPSLGNMTSLIGFTLQENQLEGSIPESIGKLQDLILIQVYNNHLSGNLPSSFFNLTSMQYIAIGSNQFTGTLPLHMFHSLPNLQHVLLYGNQFMGTIPISLSNASNLVEFDIESNSFSGSVPSNLGNLQYLNWLNLNDNQLGTADGDLSFLTSLTNCSFLQTLLLEQNRFTGILPNTIGNLSLKLNQFLLGWNQISGSLPDGIGKLYNLNMLSLNDNRFTGAIPFKIGKIQSVHMLTMSGNHLSGQIPSSIGNLTQLNKLYLQENSLNGSIPATVGNLVYLEELDLSQNRLAGIIPKELISLSSLSIQLNLSGNFLNGSLPVEISKLKNLATLDISENKLSGEIPSSLGDCQSLEYLYMEGNFFEGTIPQSFSNLRALQELDLSRNNLSGKIPQILGRLGSLSHLNLSFNNLEGELPKDGVFRYTSEVTVTGNDKLCADNHKLNLHPCETPTYRKKHFLLAHKLLILFSSVVICAILLAFVFVALRRAKSRQKTSIPAFSIGEQFMKISYAELLRATDEFSPSNLIGMGSVGYVYKGSMNSEIIAVKVLNLQTTGASKSFVAECEALRHIRHRNLVKVLTSCSSTDFQGNEFKALVLKYMPNGSLERWLHPNAYDQFVSKPLTLIQRLSIAIDVASALDYLHHCGNMPIVHCDLKPSNVLLDEDMGAHVGDFGLAKLLCGRDSISTKETTTTGIKGTIGYVPPEYGMGGQASTHGDVYSYGILLLELFTGKRPTDDMFKDGLSLHKYAEMASPARIMDIVDPALLSLSDSQEKEVQKQRCLLLLTRIGLQCSKEDPRERMQITDVTNEMNAIRNNLLEPGIEE